MIKQVSLVVIGAIVLASCGKIEEQTVSGKPFKGSFFSITVPDGFKTSEINNGMTMYCDDYGIAVMATVNPTYRKNGSQLTGFGDEFKKLFEKPTVTKEQFAGQNALYLESWKDGKMSFGYSFIVDGAIITVNASAVPQERLEQASLTLHTFKLTNERFFEPKPGDAEITQFGPSEGQPIVFDRLSIVPPKGWRILDNSTSDFISIEPRETNKEDEGQGIKIITIQGPKNKAGAEAENEARKAGVQTERIKYGSVEYSTFTAQYQQMTFVFVADVSDRQYWINISGPIDELTPKLQSFMQSVMFIK